MNLDLMSDLYMAAVCAVVVVGWFARGLQPKSESAGL